jgi:predicted N-formylglutamate amidohydrolase
MTPFATPETQGDADVAHVVVPHGLSPLLLVCDHAANAVPAALSGLGLTAEQLDHHIAWDIGAAALTRALAARLDATAVLAGYSRLLIDCNRAPDARDLVAAVSDGIAVPANSGLTLAERTSRLDHYHSPYHQQIEALLTDPARPVPVSAIVSIHSFTPRMNGHSRPWQLGILFDEDDRLAQEIYAQCRSEDGFVVGLNQPYAPSDGVYYTLTRHAVSRNLAAVMLEVRNDLLHSPAAIEHEAERLARWLAQALLALSDVPARAAQCGENVGP